MYSCICLLETSKGNYMYILHQLSIRNAVFDLIAELEVQSMGILTKGFGNIYSKENKAILEEKVFSNSED